MNTLLVIVYSLSAVLLMWFVYWAFKNPDHFLLLDNKYRMMTKIRACYLNGLKAQPQDSEEFFLRKATKIIGDYKSILGPMERREDLQFHKETVTKMLSRKEYYHYYFTQDKFNLSVFRKMHEDYRSGEFETYPYNLESKLRSVLPQEISKNKTLLKNIIKFVEAGWLDENGRPIPGVKKEQQFALAASMMCDHAGVGRYDEIFGSYWGTKPTTMRSNKRSALDSKDGGDTLIEIGGILGISLALKGE